MLYISNSPEETEKFGKILGEKLEDGDAVLFRGEMGVGKTYFTKGIARALKIKDIVTSPTYTIVNEYIGIYKLTHFDLYRLNSYGDLFAIGFFDYLDRGGIFVVEWSENISDIKDEFKRAFLVDIRKTGERTREINIEVG